MMRIVFMALALTLALMLTSCGEILDAALTADGGEGFNYEGRDTYDKDGGAAENEASGDADNGQEPEKDSSNDAETPAESGNVEDWKPEYNEYYYDVENVVLYLEAYNELPPNYITKDDARGLGWNGGSVENYAEGAAIGGDTFANREGLLPKAEGRQYTECDIDTDGYGSRGSRRLVYSNDGLYFYTDDHYETFKEIQVENGAVTY